MSNPTIITLYSTIMSNPRDALQRLILTSITEQQAPEFSKQQAHGVNNELVTTSDN